MRFFIFLLSSLLAASAAEAVDIVDAARSQIGVTVFYDPSYVQLPYPEGDVSLDRGVCTDVVIRALRMSYSIDLQQLVHEDMKKNFSSYPKIWGLKFPDRNIDHRRVPNLQTYFTRMDYNLPLSNNPEAFQPGDLVTSLVPPNLPHIMIVSKKKNKNGIPYIIHNIGGGTQEEDRLFDFPLTGHYRFLPRDLAK